VAAALPIGPYSQDIQVGNFVFVAGEKGIDPKTGKFAPGGIAAETRQTFENIKAILAEAGATLDDAVACTVHMTGLNEFQEMNRVYAELSPCTDSPDDRSVLFKSFSVFNCHVTAA
jgi:2-iminobutanoate/2-iminopropanoate deaminase